MASCDQPGHQLGSDQLMLLLPWSSCLAQELGGLSLYLEGTNAQREEQNSRRVVMGGRVGL